MLHNSNNPLSAAQLMTRIARDLQTRSADTAAMRELFGPTPDAFEKPPYGSPQYALTLGRGWISSEEE